MLSMLQNIRTFVDNRLGDLVKWSDCEAGQGSNANRASAVIAVDGCRFSITCTGAYEEPPLGTVLMRDDAGKVIEGQKRDALWQEIEAHIRGRVMEKRGVAKTAAPVLGLPEPKEKPRAPLPADGRVPHLAQGVKFYLGRGEVVAGMTELAAIVTRVNSPTSVNLTIFPDAGEPFWRDNVSRRSEAQEYAVWDFPGEVQLADPSHSMRFTDPPKTDKRKTA